MVTSEAWGGGAPARVVLRSRLCRPPTGVACLLPPCLAIVAATAAAVHSCAAPLARRLAAGRHPPRPPITNVHACRGARARARLVRCALV